MLPTPNEGDRPSQLELDRYATGELSADERADLEARMTEASRRHLAALEAEDPPPLDIAAVRARAAAIEAEARVPPANRPWAALVAVVIAAVALLVAWPTPEPAYDGLRGGTGLDLFVTGPAGASEWDGSAVAEGATLGVQVHKGTHDGVVVLSVDGTGAVSVYWPAEGADPLVLDAPTARLGTVVLDDAPGPEVFLALYDRDVRSARAAVRAAWQSGGVQGLHDLAASDQAAVEIVEVPRR